MTQRAVVSVSSGCVPGPAPRARDALEAPLLSAACRPRATYSRSSSSRPRVASSPRDAQPPNPPAEVAFCQPNGNLPSLRRVRARSLWSSESRRDSRSLRRVELARWLDTVRRGVDRRQRARRLCAPARPARASRGRLRKFPGESTGASGDKSALTATGANFPSRKT